MHDLNSWNVLLSKSGIHKELMYYVFHFGQYLMR